MQDWSKLIKVLGFTLDPRPAMESRATIASLRRPLLQRLSKWESGNLGRVSEEKGTISLVGFGENSDGLPALAGIMGIGGFKLLGITTFSIVGACKLFSFLGFAQKVYIFSSWLVLRKVSD